MIFYILESNGGCKKKKIEILDIDFDKTGTVIYDDTPSNHYSPWVEMGTGY